MAIADDFLEVADSLRSGSTEGTWRRSASSAYYAAFHRIVDDGIRLALGPLVPPDLYGRAVAHSRLIVCAKAFENSDKLAPQFGFEGTVCDDLKDFAGKIQKLYGLRVLADYNRTGFAQSTADQAYDLARSIFEGTERLALQPDQGFVCLLAGLLLRPPNKD
jgi:hypothetical protein